MEIVENIYDEYTNLINNFFENKDKETIKNNSQYFTPLNEADKLLEDLKITEKKAIKILDPAVGGGILVIKLIDKILKVYKPLKIVIDVYDTDSEIIGITRTLLEKNFNKINITLTTYNQDFMNSDITEKYDYIVQNPPYKKINQKDVPKDFIHFINGQPNLYHMFIAKALTLLEENGTLCILSPKNYLSGKYTETLRKYIFENFNITKIHTFDDRRNIFSNEVIQEVCIVHINKSKSSNLILSHNGSFRRIITLEEIIVPNDTKIIFTPSKEEDIQLISQFKKFPFASIGSEIIFKTGIVVQFRVDKKEINLQEKPYYECVNGVPLIVYRHINNTDFEYKVLTEKNNNKAITLINTQMTASKLIPNSNYVFIRKSTDKRYNNLFQSVTYTQNLDCSNIALDNSIAYFTNQNHNLSELTIFGIQCVLHSKQFDSYYRMINGSHTINVYELENIHFPNLETLESIGIKFKNSDKSIETATKIMIEFLK